MCMGKRACVCVCIMNVYGQACVRVCVCVCVRVCVCIMNVYGQACGGLHHLFTHVCDMMLNST